MTCPRNTVPGRTISRLPLWGIVLAAALPLLPKTGQAQDSSARITGRVAATDSRRALVGAHVFIANSMIGTVTDSDGRFELPRVPAGSHRFVISMLGYAPFEADSLFRPTTDYDFDVQLEPTAVALEEIVVSAREARRFQRRLLKFTRLFLGETSNSEFTTIVNPEVLTFSARLGRLSASASAPLIIENRALGYELKYFLKEFSYSGSIIKYDGDPLFAELEPSDAEEAQRWEDNRQTAFYGSKRHFFLSLLAQRTEQEGFKLYRRFKLEASSAAFFVEPETLLRGGPTPLEEELTFSGFIEIVYTGAKEDAHFRRWQRGSSEWRLGDQRSFIKLNDGPTLVDHTGEVIDPYGITEYGYFAFERLSDLMPKEYRPPDWVP